jgi:hypothetical protein
VESGGGRRKVAKYVIADLRDLLERPGVLLGLAVTALGTLLLVVGLAAAILVGPSSTWTAGRTVKPGAPAVVVTRGVVGAIGPQVTVTARRADGGALYVGRAISSDVTDLTRTTPRLLVSGVHPLRRLSTSTSAGTTSLPPVQTSDIWRDTSVGSGAQTLQWRPDTDPQAVLIASTDGSALPAVRLTVSWHRSGWFPAALAVLLLGLGLAAYGVRRLARGRPLGRGLGRLVDTTMSGLSRIPMPARRGSSPRRRADGDSEVLR